MSDFDFAVIIRSLPFLWEGMQVTLLLTALAITGGVALGAALALLRMSPVRPLAWAAGGYVNFFRSMPLILVIFWFYFLVPLLLGRPVGGFASALIAFVLFEASYYCEIIRAGIQSVRRGQVNAGLATGLGHLQTMRAIVLPQALRNMLPVLLTQGIILFQDTSLVYVVALRDFLTSADVVAARDNRIVEMYCFVAAVYFVLCLGASLSVRRLQRSYSL